MKKEIPADLPAADRLWLERPSTGELARFKTRLREALKRGSYATLSEAMASMSRLHE